MYVNFSKNIEKNLKKFYKKKESKNSKYLKLSEPIYDIREAKKIFSNFLKGKLSQGDNVKNFEKIFSNINNCKYGIATNSGSSANLIALNAIKNIFNLKNNDEVIIPASTFATVAMPIIQIGLKPVYVDVDLKTLNISVNEIKKAISKKTKIIMPVHTLGMPSNMPEIIKLAKKKNILVFEDCCESHGASINGKPVGSWGLLSAFSFFVAHNITTIEGGMILTNNKKIFKECRSLREFGRIDQENIGKNRYYSDKYLKDYDKRYVFTKIGYNMRMTDLQAALGIEQTKKMKKFNLKRIKNASFLKKLIARDLSKYFFTTQNQKKYVNTYYTFPLIIKEKINFSRKEICNFLEKNFIETRPMMGGCLPDQPAFQNSPGKIIGKLKNSRIIRDRCFFVGIHPNVNQNQMIDLVKKLKKFLN